MIKNAKSGRKSESPVKNILLFGGGICHEFKKCCPVLKSYLAKIPGFKIDYMAEDFDVFTAGRIKKYYRKSSTVINPPVDVKKFHLDEKKEKYFLMVGRLMTYKRLSWGGSDNLCTNSAKKNKL